MKIYFEHSIWWLAIALLIAAVYTIILYYKNNKDGYNKTTIYLLSSIRFVVVFIIASLITAPVLKSVSTEKQKPVIAFIQDNSESIIANKDSSFYKTEYIESINNELNKISENYDLRTFSFGDSLSELNFDFNQKSSDLSNSLYEANSKLSHLNLGAIIFASDGIYNLGQNPFYTSKKINVPIFNIALGDTTIRKDLLINQLIYNKIAYKGNSFISECEILAKKAKDEIIEVKVVYDGEQITSETYKSDNEFFQKKLRIKVDAEESGLKKLGVYIKRIDNEANYENNIKEVFIDVIESKRKVLIVYNSPHPDIFALKSAIESKQNYEVETAKVGELKKSIKAYNLIIAYQLPTNNRSSIQFAKHLNGSKIPYLFVLGNSSNLNSFNRLNSAVKIVAKKQSSNQAYPNVNPDFYTFQLNENFKNNINNFPPLSTIFGKYIQTKNIESIINQKIGNVVTDYPLISIGKHNENRVAFIYGEGIWKWKLYNFQQFKNHNIFNNFINKIVQYLSVKEQKERFQLINKRKFLENEQLKFSALFYDAAYNAVTNAEISLIIKDDNSNEYNYSFSNKGDKYIVNTGSLPPGSYTATAITKYGDNEFETSSAFIIEKSRLEAKNSTAKHSLLNQISKSHSTELLYPKDISNLKEILDEREDIFSMSFKSETFKSVLNYEWILALIILLFGFEWFLRKYNGSY